MSSHAFSQRRGNLDSLSDASLIQAPREFERLITEAKESIKNGAWSEATLAMGILLGIEKQSSDDQISTQDYFLESTSTTTVRGSLRDELTEILNTLPEAGAKVFELRYGVAAQQALDAAVATGNWKAIEKIRCKYFCTEAGRTAMWLCAESKIGHGLPMDAALILDQLTVQSKGRDRFGVGAYILSAACWKAAGQNAKATTRLDEAKKLFPKASFEWHGKRIVLTTEPQSILDALELGEYASSKRKESQPLWVGGVLDRNADTPAGVPLPLFNWECRMHESEQHEKATAKTVKQKQGDRGSSLIPARSPIIVPPWAIMMTYEQRIHAINLKTGKLDWTSGFNRIPYDLGLDRIQGRDVSSMEYPVPDYLERRIWGEAATGQLSSDGRNVYSLSEMPSKDAPDSLSIGGINHNITRAPRRRTFNVLQAWSVESEGKLSWEVGGSTGLSEPALAGVLFLGPPVANESELLILGELNTEVYLFILDSAQGHLRWSQQLVANQGSSLADSAIRRNMGCSPAVAAGYAVCPTLSGYLLGIDISSRRLSWAYSYPIDREIVPANVNNFLGMNSQNDSPASKLRSADTSVLITDGCVVHAPIDGQSVYAVSLFDGEKLWEIPKSNALYVAGGWKGNVMLVSDQAVTCLDVHNGKTVWKAALSLTQIGRVAGRGVRNGQRYFLPMTSQEILEIDFESGEIVDRMRVKEPLGNLVATTDQLISLSPIEVTAYTIRDRLRAEIDIEFAQGKSSATALQRRGKILLAEGKLGEALDAIEAAYRENRDDPEASLLLGEVAMMALREDFAKFSPRIAAYEELISDGFEKSAYLILLIDGLMQKGNHVRATERLLELTAVDQEGRLNLPSSQETIDADPTLQVRQEVWIAARLAQLHEAASASDRQIIEKLFQPRLESLAKSRRSLDYYQRSDAFRWLSIAGRLRINDAKSIFEDRDSLLSEQMLEEAIDVAIQTALEHDSNSEVSNVTSQKLAGLQMQADQLRFEIYNRAGRWTTSAALAKRLGLPLTDVQSQPSLGEIGRENAMRASGKERPDSRDFERYLGGVNAWPKGKPKVELLQQAALISQSVIVGETCVVKQRIGDALKNWTATVMPTSIELVSPDGSKRLSTEMSIRAERQFFPNVHFIDSIAFIETQSELIAMDSLRASETKDGVQGSAKESLLWQISLGRAQESQNQGGVQPTVSRSSQSEKPWEEERKLLNRKLFVVGPATRTGVIVATNNSLFSHDPRTDTRRWTRNRIGASSSLPTLLQDGHQLVVLNRSSSQKWILDARDGRMLSKEEWRDSFDIWSTAGPNALSVFENKSNTKAIKFKLWNATTGKTLLEQEYSKDVRAEIYDHERLVTWEMNGDLTFWNLRTGEKFDHHVTLPPRTLFKKIMLEKFGDALLVMTEGASFFLNELTGSESTERNQKCAGPMIAIDLEDGHPLWENPLMVYDYRFPINQVRSTPGVILTRILKVKIDAKPIEVGSVAVVDIRDGRVVYANDYLDAFRGAEFKSSAKIGRAELDFQYRGSELHLVWSDDETQGQEQGSKPSIEVGKLDRPQLQSGAPKEWLERLQLRIKEESFVPDGVLEQPFAPQK